MINKKVTGEKTVTKYLLPLKRTTKIEGKEFTHYIIATSVPEEWKDGVEITIKAPKLRRYAVTNDESDYFQISINKHLDYEAKQLRDAENKKMKNLLFWV